MSGLHASQSVDVEFGCYEWQKAFSVDGCPRPPIPLLWSANNLLVALSEDTAWVLDVQVALERTLEPKVVARISRSSDTSLLDEVSTMESSKRRSIEWILHRRASPAFVGAAWSPLGCGIGGGPLLAVADNTGRTTVHIMPSAASPDETLLLCDILASEGSSSKRRRSKHGVVRRPESGGAGEGSAIARVYNFRLCISFCPSPVRGGPLRPAALLAIAWGMDVRLWRVQVGGSVKDLQKELVATVAFEELHSSALITTLACSPLFPSFDPDPSLSVLTIAAGTSDGAVVVRRFSVHLIDTEHGVTDSNACGLRVFVLHRNAGFHCGRVDNGSAAAVDALDIVCAAPCVLPMEGIREPYLLFIAAASGIHLTIAQLTCVPGCGGDGLSDASSSIEVFQCCQLVHSLPILSLKSDPSGALAAVESSLGFGDGVGGDFVARGSEVDLVFGGRVRWLTMDASGMIVTWRIACCGSGDSPQSGRSLVQLCRVRMLEPSESHHWLTPVEQLTLGAESKPIRASRLCSRTNPTMFCAMTLSPSCCLIAAQATGRVERTTFQKASSCVLVAPMVPPAHVFPCLLWSLRSALVNKLTSVATLGGGRQGIVMSLWDISFVWGATPNVLSKEPPKEDLNAKAFVLQRFLLLLEELCKMAAPRSLGSPRSATLLAEAELRATILRYWSVADSADVDSTSTILDSVDALSRAQVRNAVRLLSARIRRQRMEPRPRRCRGFGSSLKFAFAPENVTVMWDEQEISAETAEELADYWRQRFRSAATNGSEEGDERETQTKTAVGSTTSVLEHIALIATPPPATGATTCARLGQQQRSSIKVPCVVCGGCALVDAHLCFSSCGVHVVPLCQRTFTPLFSEPAFVCAFCGRCSSMVLANRGSPRGFELNEEGLCGWCASPVVGLAH